MKKSLSQSVSQISINQQNNDKFQQWLQNKSIREKSIELLLQDSPEKLGKFWYESVESATRFLAQKKYFKWAWKNRKLLFRFLKMGTKKS